jgi:hypothetical protein
VGQLQLALELAHLAGEDPALPAGQLAGPVRDELRAAEEGEVEVAPAVGDAGLDAGRSTAAATAPSVLAAGWDDGPAVLHLREHGGLLADLQLAQVAELGAGEVAPGQQLQQVTDGLDLQRGERLGGLVADDAVESLAEAAVELGTPARVGR